MKKRILAATIVISAAILALTGCLSSEEKKALNSAEKQAEQYLEAKYGEDFTLSDSGYQIINEKTPIPAASSKMWFKFTDGTMVCYDSKAEDTDLFYDDKQSEEIKKAIIDQILAPLFDEMGDVRVGRSVGSLENAVSFNEIFDDEYEDIYDSVSVYNEYYDGDIESYLSKEDVVISSERIYLVCNEDEWQIPFEIFEKEMTKYFDLQNDDMFWWIDLFAVTEEGYENEVKAYDSDGVIASLSWDCGKRNFNVQN